MPIEIEVLTYTLAAAIAYVTVVWGVSLKLRDSSIMDIAWGPGFMLVAAVAWALDHPLGWRPAALFVLVMVWAVRLAEHIRVRNHARGEDPRYAAWRAEAGKAWWWRSWFKVFALQGVILWFVSTPIQMVMSKAGPPSVTGWDVAALVLWTVGFTLEAVADWQLLMHRRDHRNRGRIMDRGLWRFSRHPNYFGETVLWCGYALAAFSLPSGWMTVVGPILMIWLILRVSGVTMLERLMKSSRPGYAAYAKRTPAFFPWFPKED